MSSQEDIGILLHSAIDQAPISTRASFLLFGTILFATVAFTTRTWLTGDTTLLQAASNPRASPLNVLSLSSVYVLFHHTSVFGLILFFAYICENHPPYPHAEKTYDRDEFFFLTALVIIVSAYTIRRNDHGKKPKTGGNGSPHGNSSNNSTSSNNSNLGDKLQTIREGSSTSSASNGNMENGTIASKMDNSAAYTTYTRNTMTTMGTRGTYIPVKDVSPENEVLNRDQTEEWKGWMQFVFLLYHYYHANEVYNSIRIMITCYVWMTGFGNFSFFYLKGDYGLVRVLQMLWRLNFLVVFLCLTQGTTYILYYICPLHTYFFFMVYFTMRIASHVNYTKYGIRFKLAIVALIIYFLWDVDSGLFSMMHFPLLNEVPILGATNGSMWEWYFRTTLDHWSTFLGMLFALNFPIISIFYRKLEAMPTWKCWLGKGSIAVAFLLVFGVWLMGPFQQGKLGYNATNSYFGFIPLLTYIYLRNLTPTLRSHSMHLLHEIGKTTLETYLMQHHIWLTSNAKSLLTLIPGWPKVNMLVVTFLYFYISRRLYKLTLFLRGMLLPDNLTKCIRSLAVISGVILLFYMMAFLLDFLHFTSLPVFFVICITCGMLVYQWIMDLTWSSYQERESIHPGGSNKKEDLEEDLSVVDSVFNTGANKYLDDSSVARFSPIVAGSMVILILGMFWRGMAIAGAGKIIPLHSGCDVHANQGEWIAVDGCNEASRGAAYRQHGIMNIATCESASGAHVWAWKKTHSSTHCRFTSRSTQQLKKALENRRLVFVGDSMTRNLYHSVCRLLGVEHAGDYDATGIRHADITNTVGTIGLEFKWAPLAVNQLETLRVIEDAVDSKSPLQKLDMVIMGGGAWDRLHQYATDEDQESHRAVLKELTKHMIELRKRDRPVVWFTPTTINTKALNSEEKQDHMREEDMDKMRHVYEDAGVTSSASFVLDGPSFTKDRFTESYDGVHYPPEVYDAGSQILANSMDWLLPKSSVEKPFDASNFQPGKMANPSLGLMMLCFTFIALFFFDGFLGFSYVAGLFVTGILPGDLYEEAFTVLHEKMRLPPVSPSSNSSVVSLFSYSTKATNITRSNQLGEINNSPPRSNGKSSNSIDYEMAALLSGKETDSKL